MRTVMAAFIIVVSMAAVVPINMHAADANRMTKPRSPVSIIVQLADTRLDPASIKPGDEVALQAVAASSLDDPEMRITVSLSEGLQLVSGDLSWSGASVKGVMTAVPLVVRVPRDGKGKVRALVEVGPRSGHISSRAEYEFGPAKRQRSQGTRNSKKDSKGRGVVEYK